jgi:hypothetical protein
MTLEQLGAGIDFVSDSPPADATDGDTFMDTSLSPPQVKVFDGSVGSFIRPQTAQNLDQQVSSAGATQSDIISGVNAANSGIDWSSKTPKISGGGATSSGETVVSVTGSGFILGLGFSSDSRLDSPRIVIDGAQIFNNIIEDIGAQETNASFRNFGVNVNSIFRFESSFEVGAGNLNSSRLKLGVFYVLD